MIGLGLVDCTRLDDMDWLRDSKVVNFCRFLAISDSIEPNEQTLVSRDDAYLHCASGDDLSEGKLVGNLLHERFVEQDDSPSGGDGVG